MTTYSYTIVLDDSDIIALEAALDMLIQRCDKELASGPMCPLLGMATERSPSQGPLERSSAANQRKHCGS